jgi:hypothetical protein
MGANALTGLWLEMWDGDDHLWLGSTPQMTGLALASDQRNALRVVLGISPRWTDGREGLILADADQRITFRAP